MGIKQYVVYAITVMEGILVPSYGIEHEGWLNS